MPYIPVGKRPLAFMDTETTGLDPIEQEIIEIAIVIEGPDGEVATEWSTKVKPQRLETAHPKALQVNGYADHPEEWDDAPTFDEIAPKVAALLDGCVVVGHNPKFDLAFIQEALNRAGSRAKLPYHAIDTVTLAYVFLAPKGLTSLSFDKIRSFLGWGHDGAHTALQDTLDCRRLYHELTDQILI